MTEKNQGAVCRMSLILENIMPLLLRRLPTAILEAPLVSMSSTADANTQDFGVRASISSGMGTALEWSDAWPPAHAKRGGLYGRRMEADRAYNVE